MKQYLHWRITSSRLVFARAQPEHAALRAPMRVQADICQHLRRTVSAGRFTDGDNQIIIGTEARRLSQVRAGDKIIVLASDMYRGMQAVEPGVVGVFSSYNAEESTPFALDGLGILSKAAGYVNVR